MAIQDQNPFGPQSREPTAAPEMGDAMEVVIREPVVRGQRSEQEIKATLQDPDLQVGLSEEVLEFQGFL